MQAQRLKIHFIGIGGIGVSALARYYLAKGHAISGSDLVSSEITRTLKKIGAKIFIGRHSKKNLPKKPDLIVYSPAVKKDNPEMIRSIAKSYPEALGDLIKEHFTIAVSGTHGKSTTAAMLGIILTKAGLDPTVIVGTKVKEFNNSNCRAGKSKYLVVEADEHFASFLNYWPKAIVLTNIEKDHLDYYKNLNNILKTYKNYIGHLPKDGILIANKDDENIRKVASKAIFYSIKQEEAKKLRKILNVPGEHNIYNALSALTAARYLKIPDKISYQALSEYKGSWRRFEIRKGRYIVVSDYGHHPTEIKATLKAARNKWPKKEIWCVFQPHQYQRTHYLFNDFIEAFLTVPVDKLIITDIYDVAGREEKKISKKTNSKKLVESINKKNTIYLPKNKVIPYLKKNLKGGEVVVIMGAGDIYEVDKQLQ